jgi:hypothetical protein
MPDVRNRGVAVPPSGVEESEREASRYFTPWNRLADQHRLCPRERH